MKNILVATKKVLREKLYLSLFILLSPIIFFIFLLFPVVTIPGNNFSFQISIFTPKDFAFLSVLALLVSLIITMQIFIFRKNKNIKENLRSAGVSVVGAYSGIIATVFATASCSSCLAALFWFLGTGVVFFVIENRWFFVWLAIGLILVSIYFTAQKINKTCNLC
jgi:hypothetical protein